MCIYICMYVCIYITIYQILYNINYILIVLPDPLRLLLAFVEELANRGVAVVVTSIQNASF